MHVILLCEILLHGDLPLLYNIYNYNLICENTKKNSMSAGIGTYVHSSLSYIIREYLSINVEKEFESLFVEIIDRDRNAMMQEVCRVPDSNMSTSTERFFSIANALKH